MQGPQFLELFDFPTRMTTRGARDRTNVPEQALALLNDPFVLEQAEFWAGLRPTTPDSVPVVGKTPFKNLVLNTGHGTLGWTMCAGSGRVVADVVSGRTPDIDLTGLGIDRF